MELTDFIKNFAEQFDDTESSEIQCDTKFHELEEWSSLIAMGVIAMVKIQYGKSITGVELRTCVTVEDVYDLINNK